MAAIFTATPRGFREAKQAIDALGTGLSGNIANNILYRIAQEKQKVLARATSQRFRVRSGRLVNSVRASRISEGGEVSGARVSWGGRSRVARPDGRNWKTAFYARFLDPEYEFFQRTTSRHNEEQFSVALSRVRPDIEAFIRKVGRGGRLTRSEIQELLG